MLLAGIFIMVNTMWTIGITTTVTQFVRPPPYLFSSTATALLYLAPMIGSVSGEFFGHFFNDWLCNRYVRTHNGIYKQENRLWGVWPATAVGIAALVLYGQTLQHSLSWVGLAFGWGLNSFATLAATVAVSAYVLDCFPHHAALASSWINFWRTTGERTQASERPLISSSLMKLNRWILRHILSGSLGRSRWCWYHLWVSGSPDGRRISRNRCDTDLWRQVASSVPAPSGRELRSL